MDTTQSYLPSTPVAIKLLHCLVSQQELSTPRKINKPLVLYGAGELGKMAKCFFEMHEIPFLYVVDANAARYFDSAVWKSISVVKPEDVSQEDRTRCLLVICIAALPYTEVTAPLLEQGWQDIVPFYDITEAYIDRCPLNNGWFTGSLDKDDIAGIEYALDHWDDDVSRAHHLQFMAWHRLRKEWIFDNAPVTTGDRYFIPKILYLLHEREVFLDVGAHYGEVSQRFMNAVQHKFSKVYAIEPDKHNIKVLRAKFADLYVPASQDIEIIECAIGKQSGSASYFHGLDYASQISSLAQEVVVVRTLDDMDIPATFIKLHLEGWEYEALQGGMRMLNKYRPLIVTTTYHKRNGLWQLPVFLMKGMKDYVFLFRLHSWMGTGSVLYAIPRERYKRK